MPENDDSDTQDPWGISESQSQGKSSPIKVARLSSFFICSSFICFNQSEYIFFFFLLFIGSKFQDDCFVQFLPDKEFSGGLSQDELVLKDEYHTQLKDCRNIPAEIKGNYDDSVNQNIACSDPVGNGNSIRDADDLLGRPAARLKRKLNLQQVLKGICTAKYAEEADGNDPAAAHGNSDRSRIQEAEARATKDGFISTKMSRHSTERGGILPPMSLWVNHENLTPKQLRSVELKRNNVVLAGREESEVRRASPLADRTNVQVEQGIPGRWQCPRKDKPYSGPPLKQLRLERWVRRAN